MGFEDFLPLPPVRAPNDFSLEAAIMEKVSDRIKRVAWTPEEIDAKYMNRSPRQILEDGVVNFNGFCFDLTLVVQAILNAANIESKLLVEELHLDRESMTKRRLKCKVHAALQYLTPHGMRALDFWQENKCYVRDEGYKIFMSGDYSSTGIREYAGALIDPAKPLFASLGYASRGDFFRTEFPQFNMVKQLSRYFGIARSPAIDRHLERARAHSDLVIEQVAA